MTESRESFDIAIAWRDEQIDMLRQNMAGLVKRIEDLQRERDDAIARAEAAESRCRILKEEVAEWQPTQ